MNKNASTEEKTFIFKTPKKRCLLSKKSFFFTKSPKSK